MNWNVELEGEGGKQKPAPLDTVSNLPNFMICIVCDDGLFIQAGEGAKSMLCYIMESHQPPSNWRTPSKGKLSVMNTGPLSVHFYLKVSVAKVATQGSSPVSRRFEKPAKMQIERKRVVSKEKLSTSFSSALFLKCFTDHFLMIMSGNWGGAGNTGGSNIPLAS